MKKFHTCSAPIAALWKRRSVLKSWAISLTRRWKGSFLMSSSVDFWYRRISRRATVPGLQKQTKVPFRPESHKNLLSLQCLNPTFESFQLIAMLDLMKHWKKRQIIIKIFVTSLTPKTYFVATVKCHYNSLASTSRETWSWVNVSTCICGVSSLHRWMARFSWLLW